MFVLGSLAALLIGLSLGLLGGGGSVLAVPTLHYLFGLDAHAAITISLLVVGVTSAVAVIPHARAGKVRLRVGLTFGAAALASAFVAGRLSHLVPPALLLVALSAVMLVAAFAMLRPRARLVACSRDGSVASLVAIGTAVGAVTGFVGAGGGFVIVPALVLLVGIPMRDAIATSLVVIATSAFAAFGASAGDVSLDPAVVLAVLIPAVGGALVGGRLAARLDATSLRRMFGALVLVVAVSMLAIEGARLVH